MKKKFFLCNKKKIMSKKPKTGKEFIEKYPKARPIIINFSDKKTKQNYLAPNDMTLQHLLYGPIRRKFKIDAKESLKLFIKQDKKLIDPCLTETMIEIYTKYKSKDDFLYAECVLENVFG